MLERIKYTLDHFKDHNALCINDTYYTYHTLACKIKAIKTLIESNIKNSSIVGIIADNNIETYASVLALWFSGKCFVPVSPQNPKSRNELVLQQSKVNTILSSRNDPDDIVTTSQYTILNNASAQHSSGEIVLPSMQDHDLMYILFTSGSTGNPKGVPISRKNLSSFVFSFMDIGYHLTADDRFLQIYDLTFDASVHCYTIPLCVGGCIYTVPQKGIKYLDALKILQQYNITFAKMPPSTISFLEPYLDRIRLPELKYSLFGGEALYKNLIEKWQKCVPNALIQNVYGPTEATINCLYYDIPLTHIKAYNDLISIGKPFGDTSAIVVDENRNLCSIGQTGELCVAGTQITQGYWNDAEKNKESFFCKHYQGHSRRFYRTGDRVFMDADHDIMYCGREDDQVQIQGYRVELGELEKHTRDYTRLSNVAAIGQQNNAGNTKIYLFLENFNGDWEHLKSYLKEKVPHYMFPDKIIQLESFPMGVSGKIDRKALKNMAD